MSSGGGAGPLVPTFHGFVNNSMDGLILFEACLSGKLHHVPRRPHDRERSSLIKSGSIFIYEENASGIKRWTDGVAWSPSRILGNFLIYRELEKPFPPGEKKRAMKRKRESVPGEPYPRRDSDEQDVTEEITPISPPTPGPSADVKSEVPSSDQDKEMERQLIGSLVDSYGFRPDGLVKKTMSIAINGISHHMVSYYKVDDVKNSALPRPLSDPRLQNISVRPELYLKQNFRAPVEESEHYAVDHQLHAHPQMVYPGMPGTPYAVRPGQYFAGQQYAPMYAMQPSGPNPYPPTSSASFPTQSPTPGGVPYNHQPPYGGQNYSPYYKNPAPGKTEEQNATSQSMPYGGQYTPAYPNMQRNGSQGTPNMMQGSYQTPVQQGSASFGSMSARPSYGNASMASPTTNGPSPAPYGTTSGQPYAVRSPTQGYPAGAVAPSPHNNVKSPNPGQSASAPPQPMSANDPQMPYRPGSYSVPDGSHSAHPSSDMSGLGISGNSPYPPPPHQGQGGYQSYGPAGQVPAAQPGAQYGQ